jgi:hypothetical protein
MKIVNDFIGNSWIKGPSTLIEIGTCVFIFVTCVCYFSEGGGILNNCEGTPAYMPVHKCRWAGGGGGDSDTCTASHRGKPLLFSLVYYYFHWLRSQQPKVRSKKGAYLFAACLLTSMLPAKCWEKITEPNCLPPWLKYKFAYQDIKFIIICTTISDLNSQSKGNKVLRCNYHVIWLYSKVNIDLNMHYTGYS